MEKPKNPKMNQIYDPEIPSQLQGLLPCGYSYKIKKLTILESKLNHFEAIILTNVYTEEEAQEWWHEFNIASNTTMRVRATCPKIGKVNTFKIYLRCLHQGRTEISETKPKAKSSTPVKRNTGCPAGMIIAIRRLVKYSRSKMRDPVDPVHPCEIQLRFTHNHPINSADLLRFRPVSKDAEEKMINLFQIGHSPISALETLKIDLQIEHRESYPQIASDRYYCPDKGYCYRLFYKHFGKEYSCNKDISNALNSKILQYCEELGDICITFKEIGSDYAIAMCTPFMKKAHLLSQSENMIYVEQSECFGNKDRTEHNIFVLFAHTSAGGIPLGIVLTTSNSVPVLTLGFQLLQQLLPNYAFYNRGPTRGPYAFLIDASENQQTAFRTVWNESYIMFCIFRILQSMWKWLWDDKNNIHKDHCLYLLYLVKTLLYCNDETEMVSKYHALEVDNITAHYPLYLQQIDHLWETRHYWGICFHRLVPLQDANNYYEATVRTLKDRTCEQIKSFNILQLTDFLVTRIDLYYKTKLLAIVKGKVNHIVRSHHPIVVPSHIASGITRIAGNYFLVPSENDGKLYTVDVELNSCTCGVGVYGSLCEHQYWIFLNLQSEMFQVTFMTPELKLKLEEIVMGTKSIMNSLEMIVHSRNKPQSSIRDDLLQPHVDSNYDVNVPNAEITAKSNVPALSPQLNSEILSTAENVQIANHPLESMLPSDSLQVLPDISNATKSTSSILSSLGPFVTNIISIHPSVEKTMDIQNDAVPLHPTIDDEKSIQNDITSPCTSIEIETNIQNVKHNTDIIMEDATIQKVKDEKMDEVSEKFETFCQRVKEGLKSQPKDFIPAVEIMMKNLERKGNSSEVIVSSLSLFGVLAAPCLKNKPRKQCVLTQELKPRVYGRQMITYGKRRVVSEVQEDLKSELENAPLNNSSTTDGVHLPVKDRETIYSH